MYKDTDIWYWQKTNTQAKQQNGISYHLLFCFLSENATEKSMILRGCFISKIVLNLTFGELKKYL